MEMTVGKKIRWLSNERSGEWLTKKKSKKKV